MRLAGQMHEAAFHGAGLGIEAHDLIAFGLVAGDRAVEQSRLFGSSVILIEDKASGTQLIQELREAGVTRYSV